MSSLSDKTGGPAFPEAFARVLYIAADAMIAARLLDAASSEARG